MTKLYKVSYVGTYKECMAAIRKTKYRLKTESKRLYDWVELDQIDDTTWKVTAVKEFK